MYVRLFKVQIIQLNEEQGTFVHKATFDHPYPTTKIMWIPDVVSPAPTVHVHCIYNYTCCACVCMYNVHVPVYQVIINTSFYFIQYTCNCSMIKGCKCTLV